MKYLRNIVPYEPVNLLNVLDYEKGKIASKALIDNEHTEIRFFAFAKGESIDKEYYEMETIFFILDGTLKILYKENDERIVNVGEMIALESGVDYGVEAMTDVKLYNILIKE